VKGWATAESVGTPNNRVASATRRHPHARWPAQGCTVKPPSDTTWDVVKNGEWEGESFPMYAFELAHKGGLKNAILHPNTASGVHKLEPGQVRWARRVPSLEVCPGAASHESLVCCPPLPTHANTQHKLVRLGFEFQKEAQEWYSLIAICLGQLDVNSPALATLPKALAASKKMAGAKESGT
jgi:hypothetical protein